MSDKELMKSIPNSYEDFVSSMTYWMGRDENIRVKILDYLRAHSDPTTSDLLGVLWDCLGVGTPLELIDDGDSDNITNVPSMRATG